MREELQFESSEGVVLEGVSFGQKILAGVVSFIVTAVIILLPLVV